MAFFTAVGTAQVLTGTPNADNFQLLVASGITVLADAGNDRVNARSSYIDGGSYVLAGGSDTIIASGISGASILGGAGGDQITQLKGDYLSLLGNQISLGNGNDSIGTIGSGYISGGDVTLGAGADSIGLSGIFDASVAFGAGADTLKLDGSAYKSDIEMGGGADSVYISAYFGSGTLALGAGADKLEVKSGVASALIQGGGNADTITIGEVSAEATIRGGAGADSIKVDFIKSASSIFGDDGADTIIVSGYVSSDGFLAGGAGNDSITLNDNSQSAILYGGAGADTLFAGSSDAYFKYEAGSESNINAIDSIAVSANLSGFIYATGYATTDITIFSSQDVGAFSTNNVGVVTFTSTIGAGLTERAQQLSDALGPMRSVIFNADGGRYLFIAGNTKGTLEDDLLIEVNASVDYLSADGKTLQFSD